MFAEGARVGRVALLDERQVVPLKTLILGVEVEVLLLKSFLANDDLFLSKVRKGLVRGHKLVELFLEVHRVQFDQADDTGVVLIVHALRSDACITQNLIIERICGFNQLIDDMSRLHLISLKEPIVEEFEHAGLLNGLEGVYDLRLIGAP